MSARNIRLLGMCLSTSLVDVQSKTGLMSARNIRGYCACAMFSTYVQPKSWTQNRPISRCLQTGDAIDLTSGRRAELKHEAVESWSDSHAPAPARQSACSQSYQGVFDCINVPLVNVVERMSARNVGATAHYVIRSLVDVQSKTA